MIENSNRQTEVQSHSGSQKTLKRFNPEEIKINLKKLFFNYGQYIQKESNFFITIQSINKLLKLCGITDSGLVRTQDIDILFHKVDNKTKKLDQKQFIDFFVLLCERMASDIFSKSKKLAIEAVYRDYIYPLCKSIDTRKISNEEFNSGFFLFKAIEDLLIEFQISDFHFIIINDIINTLFEIYKTYFHYENNNYNEISKIVDGSLENLMEFARDFEIVPYNVSLNQLVVYYNIITSRLLDQTDVSKTMNNSFINSGYKPQGSNEQESKEEVNTKNQETEKIKNKSNETFQSDGIKNEENENIPKLKNFLDFPLDKINTGKVFKFLNFLELVIHLSEISFQRLSYSQFSNMNQIEKFLVFLEKLQSSNGFQNFERKTNKPHSMTSTLVPNKSTLIKIDPNIVERKFGNPEVLLLKEKGKEIKEIHKKSNEESFDIAQLMSINEENLAMLEMKLPLIKDIFISYTGYSDKLSFMKLNFSAYLKFLKDSKLVQGSKEAEKIRTLNEKEGINTLDTNKKNISYRKSIFEFSNTQKGKLTITDATLIFQSLTGPKNTKKEYTKDELLNKDSIDVRLKDSNNSCVIDRKTNLKTQSSGNRLDFFLFIKSFEMLAMKFYPNSKLNYAFKQFLLIDMKGVLDNRRNISVLYSQEMLHTIKALKDEKIVAIIQSLHDVMLPLYQNYCDNAGYMNFEMIFNFYKDFEIFPEIVNLIQLKNIFFVLSESMCSNSKEQEKSENGQGKRNLLKNEYIFRIYSIFCYVL